MRRHIASALRTRSDAIKTALKKYNAAGAELRPPRESLEWEEVVEYSFLADFDLLRETRQDIRKKPWASPVGRSMMDQYFKLLRAKEEIIRLNVEIRRVITHLEDETEFLEAHEIDLASSDPILAHQVRLYRLERLQYKEHHIKQFKKLENLPGFTGTLTRGFSVDQTLQKGTIVFVIQIHPLLILIYLEVWKIFGRRLP